MTVRVAGANSLLAALLATALLVPYAPAYAQDPGEAIGIASALAESVVRAIPDMAGLPEIPTELLPAEAPSEANPLFAAYSRGAFEPPVAIDINPDEGIVEVVLVAHPSVWSFEAGTETLVWTYNGTIPGPTIEATEGDRLIVHFLNLLPEATTIHWHGVEVPADMDGTHVSQQLIEPGQTFTYDFQLLRPALYWYHPHHRSNVQVENGLYAALLVHAKDEALALPPGSRETILVLDDVVLDPVTGQITEEFPVPSDPTARAEVMQNGKEQLFEPTLLVNGKVGRVLSLEGGVPQRFRLLNSANSRFMRMSLPGETLHLVGGDSGLLAAPEARPPVERLDYRDPRHPCHDPSNPNRPDPTCAQAYLSFSDPEIDHGVLLTPGERADVIWTPSSSVGASIPLEWHDWFRGRHTYLNWGDRFVAGRHVHGPPGAVTLPQNPPHEMARFQMLGSGAPSFVPAFDAPVAPIVDRGDWGGGLPPPCGDGLEPPQCVRRLVVEYGHTARPDDDGNLRFWVQTGPAQPDGTCPAGRIPLMTDPGRCGIPFDAFTGDDAYDLEVGETVIWEVTGSPHADHNFHTHGFFFQPLEYEYVVTDVDGNFVSRRIERLDDPHVQNKDTIIIPRADSSNLGSKTVFRAAARIDDTGREGRVAAFGGRDAPGEGRSGGWMFHCHILEHAARGMMAFFEVREAAP